MIHSMNMERFQPLFASILYYTYIACGSRESDDMLGVNLRVLGAKLSPPRPCKGCRPPFQKGSNRVTWQRTLLLLLLQLVLTTTTS